MIFLTLSVDRELSIGCSCNQIVMGETADVVVKSMASRARHPPGFQSWHPTTHLCDFSPVIQPVQASVPLSVKGGEA